MRFKLIFMFSILACALASSAAHAGEPSTQKLSRSELKRMMQNAHTTEDYMTLASYFRWRKQQFDQDAHEEFLFLSQRSRYTSLLAGKYPRPSDFAKDRYDYDVNQSKKMSAQAARYETLSEDNH